MKKLEDLTGLEKKSNVDLRYCEIISDRTDEDANARYRILKDGERYFFHKMKDGEVVECYELALSWKPTSEIFIFAYTPDDRHVYQIDSRNPKLRDVFRLDEKQIHDGDSCAFRGHKLEYVNENTISLNGVRIRVERCGEYVYQLRKTKINAMGAACGLYIFLENIAEEEKVKLPLFDRVWDLIAEKYSAHPG